MYYARIELTPAQEAWLRKHFKHTKNAEIAERLGISETSVHRFARKWGLTKTKQFRRKVQADVAAAAKASHLRNGTYPPKGYIIPGSEAYRFKPGESMKSRIGTRRWKQACAKAQASRAKTFRWERARRTFGVPQKTKLKVFQQPRQRILDRCYLKKRGYIIDEQNFIAYWTPETQRATRLEARPKRYYRFEKHPDLV